MRSIAGRTRNIDSLRLAVLAGLNIADEHHQLKAKYEAVSEKVGACDQVLDEILRIGG